MRIFLQKIVYQRLNYNYPEVDLFTPSNRNGEKENCCKHYKMMDLNETTELVVLQLW